MININTVELIFVLMGLHCLADYPLQGEFVANFKGKLGLIMVAHCFIWTLCIYFGLWVFKLNHFAQLPFLFFGHYAIDSWKCSRSGNGKELGSDLLIDQMLHVTQIVFCVTWGIYG